MRCIAASSPPPLSFLWLLIVVGATFFTAPFCLSCRAQDGAMCTYIIIIMVVSREILLISRFCSSLASQALLVLIILWRVFLNFHVLTLIRPRKTASQDDRSATNFDTILKQGSQQNDWSPLPPPPQKKLSSRPQNFVYVHVERRKKKRKDLKNFPPTVKVINLGGEESGEGCG